MLRLERDPRISIGAVFEPTAGTRYCLGPLDDMGCELSWLFSLVRLLVGGSRRSRPRPSPDATTSSVTPKISGGVLRGRCWVVDGDTIVIDDVHIRLAGIDAPELDHPWGNQSKWALVKLCKGHVVTARPKPESSYNRVVAECFLPDGRDLSAEMVKAGLAIDWPKYSGGKYRALEVPNARRKMWRADARQRGRLPPASTG